MQNHPHTNCPCAHVVLLQLLHSVGKGHTHSFSWWRAGRGQVLFTVVLSSKNEKTHWLRKSSSVVVAAIGFQNKNKFKTKLLLLLLIAFIQHYSLSLEQIHCIHTFFLCMLDYFNISIFHWTLKGLQDLQHVIFLQVYTTHGRAQLAGFVQRTSAESAENVTWAQSYLTWLWERGFSLCITILYSSRGCHSLTHPSSSVQCPASTLWRLWHFQCMLVILVFP